MINVQLTIPLAILLALSLTVLCREVIRHGETKKEQKYNFWTSLFANAVGVALWFWHISLITN